MNKALPEAEISNPSTTPFLYPSLAMGSPDLTEMMKYSREPTK